MTKKDLRTGMFGRMDNGMNFVIVNDLIVYETGEWDDLSVMKPTLSLPSTRISLLVDSCCSFDQLKSTISQYYSNNSLPTIARVIYAYEKDGIGMTISEIEKLLHIKNLKIIAED